MRYPQCCEEQLEGVELLWDTLDVVETVDPDDDFATRAVLLKVGNALPIYRLQTGRCRC